MMRKFIAKLQAKAVRSFLRFAAKPANRQEIRNELDAAFAASFKVLSDPEAIRGGIAIAIEAMASILSDKNAEGIVRATRTISVAAPSFLEENIDTIAVSMKNLLKVVEALEPLGDKLQTWAQAYGEKINPVDNSPEAKAQREARGKMEAEAILAAIDKRAVEAAGGTYGPDEPEQPAAKTNPFAELDKNDEWN